MNTALRVRDCSLYSIGRRSSPRRNFVHHYPGTSTERVPQSELILRAERRRTISPPHRIPAGTLLCRGARPVPARYLARDSGRQLRALDR